MIKTVKSIWFSLRDLLIRVLPSFITRFIIEDGEFAFLVHPRDFKDAIKRFPIAGKLPKKILKIWERFQWPLIASQVTGFMTKSGKELKGWIVICPVTVKTMFTNQRLARLRISQSVKLAEKLGAELVGLGAFTSILTNDGLDLAGRFKVGFTTGNAYSAAIAIQNIRKAAELIGLELKLSTLAIVGAAGSVGSACAKILLKEVDSLLLVDINKKALNQLQKNMESTKSKIQTSNSIKDIKEADIVLAVTSSPGAIITAKHLKIGAIVIDAGQPKNVSEDIPKRRKDVVVIESAIAKAPGVRYDFNLDVYEDEVLGCLGELLILRAFEWEGNYSLGKVSIEQIREISKMGEEAGLYLADFRNSQGIISKEDINRIKKLIARIKV